MSRTASESPSRLAETPATTVLTRLRWPAPPGVAALPRWTGDTFLLGEERVRILSYETTPSHWNSELTDLHESEAGANHPIDRASHRLAMRSVQKAVAHEGAVALDAGCSSGFLLEELRSALPGAALIGADVILPPLQKLAARLPGVPLLQFDLQRCPLPDECVDVVTALNVLEHIECDDVALRQLNRIVKRGGIVHLEVPAGPELFDIYDEQLLHYRRYRLGELIRLARNAGFQIQHATHLGAFLYPAFYGVKKRNRKLLQLPLEEKRQRVARQIRRTSDSHLLRWLLWLETSLFRHVRWPFGVRCVVVLQKPQR